jgi:predicted permease
MTRSDFKLRLRALFRPRRVEADLDEELAFHLAMQAHKHQSAGANASDADRLAAHDFGGITQVRENCRDQRGLLLVEIVADVRYALRGFRHAPGFTFTVVATIALGLGLNTAAFTTFSAYVLRPLAVRDPTSLYEVSWNRADGSPFGLSWQQVQDCGRNVPALSEFYGYSTLVNRVDGHYMFGQLVSGEYFSMLGGETRLGRPIVADDALAPGSQPVAVLSFSAWKNKYDSDPAIVGKKLLVHGDPLQIVGVAREGFTGVGELPWDFWAPLTMRHPLGAPQDGSLSGIIRMVGRLRPGWSTNRARSALLAWARPLTAGEPREQRLASVDLTPRATTIPLSPKVLAGLAPIFAAFGLVLVVACANIANLMLARAMARQREIGVRLAIGAGRKRLIRQLLTESVVLALPAALAGFAISQVTIEACVRLLYTTMPRGYLEMLTVIPLHPDARVFLFMLGATVAAALLFGLVPAVQATRPDIMLAARGEFTTDHRPARLRHTLVAAQVAVSALVLIGAAVLFHQNVRVAGVQPGLDVHGVVQMNLQESMRAKVIEQLLANPLVEQVESSSKLPFRGFLPWIAVTPDGTRYRTPAGYMSVSPGYFSLFRVPILRGRGFTQDDVRAKAPVTVISEATARRLFPGRDAIGQRFRIGWYGKPALPLSQATVIGVARDAANGWIGEGNDSTCIYFATRVDNPFNVLLVRASVNAETARQRLDAALARTSPGSIDEIHTMEEILEMQRYPFQIAYWISFAVGGLALALTLAGIYGVLSHVVAQRTKEIGIRVALGARSGQVVVLVLKESMRFALIGTAIGAAGGLLFSRYLAAQFVGMERFDIRAFAGGIALVFTSSALAAWAPSIRATRIEPATILRRD